MEFPWLFLFEKKTKRKTQKEEKRKKERKESEIKIFEESDQPWWECKIFVIFDSISFHFGIYFVDELIRFEKDVV